MNRIIRAFTLIELLVVIAIISLLVTVLVPSLSEAQWQAKMAKCCANLHAVGLAIGEYQFVYEMDHPFIFDGGKADLPFDNDDATMPGPGNPALALANPDFEMFIDDPWVFFCPVTNYDVDINYTLHPIGRGRPDRIWGTYIYVYPHLLPADDPFHPFAQGRYSHDNTRGNIGPNSEDVVMYDGWVDPYIHTNALLLNAGVQVVGNADRWSPIDAYLYGGPPWY